MKQRPCLLLPLASLRLHIRPIPTLPNTAFINCLFYDFEIMAATDRVYLGGDILILGGTATFTGCMWIYTTVMAGEAGAGFNVALLNGVAVFTFCNFNELNGVIHTDGVGQIFMVAGACCVRWREQRLEPGPAFP